MAYKLQVEKRALRDLERLLASDYVAVARAINGLAAEPRPRNARKLKGLLPLWRIRIGEYRIVYAIFDPDSLVRVVRIARRSERTYEGL